MGRGIGRTIRMPLVAAVTLGVAASLLVIGTHGGFIAQTTNQGNVFQVGTLKITNLGFSGGSFSVSNIAPGSKQSNSIALTNTGSLDALLRLQLGPIADATATSGTCDPSNTAYVSAGTACGQASLSSALQLLVYVSTASGGVCVYPLGGASFVSDSSSAFVTAETACGYGALGGSGGFPAAGQPVPFGTTGPAWPSGASQSMTFAVSLPATVQNEALGTSTTVDFSWQSEPASSGTSSGSGTPVATATTAAPGSTPVASPTPAVPPATPTAQTPSLTFSPASGSRTSGTTISVSGTGLPDDGTYAMYLASTTGSPTIGAGQTATVSGGVLSGSFSTQDKPEGTYYLRVVNTTPGSTTDITSTSTLTITP